MALATGWELKITGRGTTDIVHAKFEKISTELQHHPSDLPVNPLMLQGVRH